jgi:hypothetical protein
LAGWARFKSGRSLGWKPAEIVVLVRGGVDRFAVPARDEERVHGESVVTDSNRDGYRGVYVDPEFFEAFSADGLVRQLAGFDMSADEIPAVGIPPTRRVAMCQEHETVADK